MNKSGGMFQENSPQTEAEAIDEQRIHDIVEKIMENTVTRRRILSLQELCELKHPHVWMEQFFPEIGAYFFSVNGTLKGESVKGGMLAGHCMLVFAISLELATEIATDGLLDTIELANDYAHSDAAAIEAMEAEAANAGIITSASCNRSI